MTKKRNKTNKSPKKYTDALHLARSKKNTQLHDVQLKVFDKLVFIAGPMIPVAIAPTSYNVWVNGQTDGISMLTWCTLSATSFVMACYALLHRDKVLILTYTPLFLLNLSVVIGYLVKF